MSKEAAIIASNREDTEFSYITIGSVGMRTVESHLQEGGSLELYRAIWKDITEFLTSGIYITKQFEAIHEVDPNNPLHKSATRIRPGLIHDIAFTEGPSGATFLYDLNPEEKEVHRLGAKQVALGKYTERRLNEAGLPKKGRLNPQSATRTLLLDLAKTYGKGRIDFVPSR